MTIDQVHWACVPSNTGCEGTCTPGGAASHPYLDTRTDAKVDHKERVDRRTFLVGGPPVLGRQQLGHADLQTLVGRFLRRQRRTGICQVPLQCTHLCGHLGSAAVLLCCAPLQAAPAVRLCSDTSAHVNPSVTGSILHSWRWTGRSCGWLPSSVCAMYQHVHSQA